jgi:3D (Asp-Asp-Asp) domain-containing protein
MRLLQSVLVFSFALGCGAASRRVWTYGLPEDEPPHPRDDSWLDRPTTPSDPGVVGGAGERSVAGDEAIEVRDLDDGSARTVIMQGATDGAASSDDLFRNTYYDFPREGAGRKTATIFDASCAEIAKVTQDFHDRVCVQGSGRIESGATVSFAKRDCACAAACPRTGQKLCFDRLDAARYPHGRGATGRAITPLRTVAVDSAVIPLGTPLFVPEFVGLPRVDGTPHDGCFVAEDRGLKVVGRQIDVFTGDPALTARYNALVPSNRGVHVRINDARCRPGG